MMRNTASYWTETSVIWIMSTMSATITRITLTWPGNLSTHLSASNLYSEWISHVLSPAWITTRLTTFSKYTFHVIPIRSARCSLLSHTVQSWSLNHYVWATGKNGSVHNTRRRRFWQRLQPSDFCAAFLFWESRFGRNRSCSECR